MNPYLNPKKYYNKLRSIYYQRSYDLDAMRKDEIQKYSDVGLSYHDAVNKLNSILLETRGTSFSDNESSHWLLFSAVSLLHPIKNILEIGTYTGEATALLAKVFPEATITTVDLPDNDPILKGSYGRESEESMRRFKEIQRKNISHPNIEFIATNSFFLPSVLNGRTYDLIWVDGAHLYPEVSWDICNAYHLCNSGGILMCDDIVLQKDGYRDAYVSPDSYEVFEYIKDRTNDSIMYFLKRLSPQRSADPKKRKYISVLMKS